jgi:hypothetical protein
MSIRVHDVTLTVLNMRTRMPFRYGIATLTTVPHLFVRAEMEVDGQRCIGISSEGLAPKWFTKIPEQSFRDELADMLHVIESAAGYAQQVGDAPSVFDLWQQVYAEQLNWATFVNYPPLLWSFGVSLIERAVIEGFCRAKKTTFAAAVRSNALGVRLGELHSELGDFEPAQLLPPQPVRSMYLRHTVGLADPLTDADITVEDRAGDGLPQSLEAAIAAYGLRYFKIKLGGDPEKDVERLTRIAALLPPDAKFTLDGNEFYKEVEPFEQTWERLRSEPALAEFMRGLLFIEQPMHRDVALSADVEDELSDWDDRPAMIIDESDALIGSAKEAIDSGYAGTSHKNCKGVIKGLANACLLEHRRRTEPERTLILSGEDLCSVGPVAMIMDLAAVATFGLEHVERNGHHYFRGLSMYPAGVQEQVLERHGDLYEKHTTGGESFPTLKIRDGRIDIGSVVDAPFGVAIDLDPVRFTPIDKWTYESLEK